MLSLEYARKLNNNLPHKFFKVYLVESVEQNRKKITIYYPKLGLMLRTGSGMSQLSGSTIMTEYRR